MEPVPVQIDSHPLPTVRTEQAANDDQVIAMWLHGKSTGTIRAYSLDAGNFLSSSGKGIRAVTVGDLQKWTDSLQGSANRKNRAIMAVKSLLTFSSKIGYTNFNVGAVVKGVKIKNTLTERIISEGKVHEIFAMEPSPRNKRILKTLYYSGVRVSELVTLQWKDLREDVLTVFGKGGKTRYVRLPEHLSEELENVRQDNDDTIFQNRSGKEISAVSIWKVVKKSGQRVGVQKMSPHWFRHAHASHALDRHAPPHLVQTTLGHSSLVTTSKYSHAKPDDSSGRYLS